MRISTIVPIGNRESCRQCRESILRSIEAAKDRGCDWDVVEVFDDERRGVSWARNEGLRRASGEYVAWVDDDDVVTEDWAAAICDGLESRPDVLSFDAKAVWRDSSRRGYCIGGGANAADVMSERANSQLWNKVIRRELFDGLEFHGAVHEDYRLLCELLPKARTFKHVAKSLYVYQRSKSGASQFADAKGVCAALNGLAEMCESLPPEFRREMRKGVSQRIADFCLNANGNRAQRAFIRRGLADLLSDGGISAKAKVKCALAAFGARREWHGSAAVSFRIKQALFWIGYRIDQWLPKRLCVAARNRCAPWRRPILDVVELHLADHCNLNCAGCLHFTPLASKWCARPEDVERDLSALRGKFRYIRHVTLLGGEPLLNPDYAKIVEAVNRVSPESLITIVTNGVLLKGEALDGFLDVCKRFSVRVKWTVYPPMRGRRAELVSRFRQAGVRMFTVEVGDFYVKMRPEGGNPKSALAFCRKTTYCPYLRDGRIYTCAQAFHVKDYIKLYEEEAGRKSDMVASRGLDVHDVSNDGWSILKYLMTPCETCRFCADSFRHIPWSQSARHFEEWVCK